jgi:hypothetical protein
MVGPRPPYALLAARSKYGQQYRDHIPKQEKRDAATGAPQ